jgi:hypothetical protein
MPVTVGRDPGPPSARRNLNPASSWKSHAAMISKPCQALIRIRVSLSDSDESRPGGCHIAAGRAVSPPPGRLGPGLRMGGQLEGIRRPGPCYPAGGGRQPAGHWQWHCSSGATVTAEHSLIRAVTAVHLLILVAAPGPASEHHRTARPGPAHCASRNPPASRPGADRELESRPPPAGGTWAPTVSRGTRSRTGPRRRPGATPRH